MAAPAFDFLDSMMWAIGAAGLIVAIAAFRLKYNASTDSFEESNQNLSKGMGVALGAVGLYVFITGLAISFAANALSPNAFNPRSVILFGGASSLAGIALLTLAMVFYFGRGFQAASYLGFVVGLYLVVDAYAQVAYNMGKDPLKGALVYLAPAALLLYSPVAAHLKTKYARWVFGILAILVTIAWLYFGYTTTLGHLAP